MKFDLEEINKLIEQGYIIVQKHPVHPLWIYNYSNKCQWEKFWTKITLACRGLVLDEEGNVVARSFPKFFNYEELPPEQLPSLDEEYIVTEKLDGSLILAFKYNGELVVASRGSFTSEQAIKAKSLITPRQVELIPEGITVVFEIIYPENRVVVDYGIRVELVLLTIIRSFDGAEKDYGSVFVGGSIMGFKIVKLISCKDYRALKETIKDNEEGYVIHFKSGLRIKIKGSEYLRLHRIMTQISSRDIWEHLSLGKDINYLIERVPDEFMNCCQLTIERFKKQYQDIRFQVEKELSHIVCNETYSNQKEFAEIVKNKTTHPHLIFAMNTNKEWYLNKEIWKLIYPQRELPFNSTRT